MKRFKSKITPFIEAEIATRYYYQGGYVCQQLKSDKVFHEALKLIADEDRYRNILKNGTVTDK